MKRYILPIIGILALPLSAQNLVDATRFGSTDITGTARYRSMAGAFGALGGDMSCMTDNPAGMGIFRGTSSYALTPNLSFAHTTTEGSTDVKQRKASGALSNLAAVMSFRTRNAEHLVNFNVGIGFNHSEDMSRRYHLVNDQSASSFGDYLANRANNALLDAGHWNDYQQNQNNDMSYPYLTGGAYNDSRFPLSAIYGYDCFAIDDAGYVDQNTNKFVATGGVAPTMGLGYQRMTVREETRHDEFNINMSANWEDLIYGGITVSISDFNSMINTEFNEDYNENYDGSYTQYFNDLETKGRGVGIKAGILVKPTDTWRVGVAVHTPTWMKMTDIYSARMITDDSRCTDYSGGQTYEYDYRYFTPWEYQVSTAWVLGGKALLSVEYDMRDFTSMKYKVSHDGVDMGEMNDINDAIKDYAALQHTFKTGFEYRLGEHWSARAGYAFRTSPYKDKITKEQSRGWDNGYFGDDNTLCFDSSTKPNYNLVGTQQFVTCGVGWHTSDWYIDLSLMNHFQNDKICAYPTTDALMSVDNYGVCTMSSNTLDGAVRGDYFNMKTHNLKWDLTIGCRF